MKLRPAQLILPLFGLYLATLAVSCTTAPEPQLGGPLETLDNLVQMQLSEIGELKKPEELTLTQPNLKLRKRPYHGPRISLSVENVDIKTILFQIAQEVDQNIIIHPGISETATVDLKNVTLTEALDSLLSPLRLHYEVENGFIRIAPEKMETRIFHLNYILSRREGASGLVSARGRTAIWDAGAAAAPGASTFTGKSGFASSVRSFEETDLWREIEAGLREIVWQKKEAGVHPPTLAPNAAEKMLPGDPVRAIYGDESRTRPYFSINRQSGIIMVREYPDVLNHVAAFLEAVEGSVQRQVFIQAKFVEVVLNNQYRRGIDWTEVNPLGITRAEVAGFENSSAHRSKGVAYGVGNASQEVILKALARQGDVTVLSSPKIATLNNQRAVIRVGTEDIFFVPQTRPANGGAAAAREFIPSPLSLGIVLDVLPQVNVNGTIMMSINTSISEKTGERVSPDGVTVVPVIGVRESNNVIICENGQTIVIGGLMSLRKEVRNSPVPGLGSLPVIGSLFQVGELNEKKTELVIMLTPEIMTGMAIDDRFRIEENRLWQLGNSRSAGSNISSSFQK